MSANVAIVEIKQMMSSERYGDDVLVAPENGHTSYLGGGAEELR